MNATGGSSLPYRVVSGDATRFDLDGAGFVRVPAWNLRELVRD